jgi:hypothetical protein
MVMKKLANILNVDHIEFDYSEMNFDDAVLVQEALRRNSEIVECPKCGVTGNYPNMMRWHFESCKTVLKSCQHCNNIIPRQGIKDHLYTQKNYCDRKCYMESKKGKNPILLTDEMKNKISQKNSKKIMVDGVIYNSRTEMNKEYKLSGQNFKKWVECGKITYIKV